MMVQLLAIVAALLCTAMSASAHRLDEYLQAATIELTPGSIVVQLRLTPGVSVAPLVTSGIASDGDGSFSAAGQASYAETVRQDLSLTLDGHTEPLRLVSFQFPAVQELTAGTGNIGAPCPACRSLPHSRPATSPPCCSLPGCAGSTSSATTTRPDTGRWKS